MSRRRWRVDAAQPVLLIREERQREVVASCCTHCARAGVRPGMALSEARAMLRREPHVERLDEPLLARALRRLAIHALRFTPNVSVESPDGLWLDITGCVHLFKDEATLAHHVVRMFNRMGLVTWVAIAPWYGAAWGLARFGLKPICIVDRAHLRHATSTLPLCALRLPVDVLNALNEVGIETIEHLLAVPRAELARRYGLEVLRRLDQAFGRERELQTPIRVRPPLTINRAFAGPTDRLETIQLCAEQLISIVCQRLEQRGAGCRELLLVLTRSDLAPLDLQARSSKPTRDTRHWITLLRPRLERAHLGYGVEALTLTAGGIRTLRHEQIVQWCSDDSPATSDDLTRLADTLMSRLGAQSVRRIYERESHLPERAFAFVSVENGLDIRLPSVQSPPVERPSLLLPSPMPIRVSFLFPEGPIGSVDHEGVGRRVLSCIGPERICGEWWHRDRFVRDYYRLQTDDGAWLWIFRELTLARWFLHGEWA